MLLANSITYYVSISGSSGSLVAVGFAPKPIDNRLFTCRALSLEDPHVHLYTTTKGGLFPHEKNKIMTVFGLQNVCQVRGLPITVSVESMSSWTRAICDEMSVQSID